MLPAPNTLLNAGGETIVVDAVELLFAGFGSAVEVETVAVFEIDPVAVAWMLSVIEAVPELAIVPSEQETVVVPLQLPCDGIAETNDVPAGRTSVTDTPLAALGPALLTVMV